MPLSMLKAAKVKFCYLQGMQNPWRSPSYCWPVGSSLARVEMTCSWCCVSCWKLELAETAVLLPHGEEQCRFPTEIWSLWNGYSPMGKSGFGPESGNVQCWLWWKSEINVPIHIWVRKKKQGKLSFFWDNLRLIQNDLKEKAIVQFLFQLYSFTICFCLQTGQFL